MFENIFEKIFLFVLSLLGPRFKLVLGIIALSVVAVIAVAGFRGEKTRRTPVELFPDMDRQFKLRPQTKAGFYAWANNMSSRLQVAGTVSQQDGFVDNTTWAQNAVNTGKDNAAFVEVNPLPINLELRRVGQWVVMANTLDDAAVALGLLLGHNNTIAGLPLLSGSTQTNS